MNILTYNKTNIFSSKQYKKVILATVYKWLYDTELSLQDNTAKKGN